MKSIGLFPFGGPTNFYPQMIADCLGLAGYKAVPLQDTRFFPLRRAAHSGVDALHLLWPGNLYHSSTVVGTWIKRAMFHDGLCCLNRTPAVYSADNLYAHDVDDVQRELVMVQQIVNKVRAVTVASSAAENCFREAYKVTDKTKIFRVPHRHYIGKYPDTVSKAEARARLSLPPSAPIVLSLGRITPYKGLPTLVSAFLRAEVDGAILLVAGPENAPGAVAAIRNVADQSAFAKDIRIHARFIPDEELQLYLRAADLMALAYEDVPMNPGSVILAMSFGLPVCCVADGSVPEILGEALYGYSRGDELGQARVMREALLDIDALAERGKIARNRAEINHSPEVVAEGLAAVYRHVFR